MAVAAATLATPVLASQTDREALLAYARARAADVEGEAGLAARGYAEVLARQPGNEILAARALSQAIEAGDRPLALAAARTLERAGQLAPDGRLLLLTEAVRQRDWNLAEGHVQKLEQDEVFSFLAPLMRAWIAQGSGEGDPIAILAGAERDQVVKAYLVEHRPLLMIARGQEEEGAAELARFTAGGGARARRLKLAGAAKLAEEGKRAEALKLLEGSDPVLAEARALVTRRRKLPGAIDDAATGISDFLLRVSIDLHQQEVAGLALTFARLSTMLNPTSTEPRVILAELLSNAKQPQAALAVLGGLERGDPLAAAAGDLRARLLVAADRGDQALGEAEAAARRQGAGVAEWTHLGDLYVQLQRPAEAAMAYDEALKRHDDASPTPLWALHLLRGGALDQAGNWSDAKVALEEAYRLAPDQPLVLNYLGYGQLERRENLAEAEKMVAKASSLEPDNHAITDSLGWAYYLKGDLPKAIELLERAARGEPADPEINEHLGDAYFSAGRRVEARYAWRAALIYAEEGDAQRLRSKIDAGLKPELASP